jgi:large subunit ribosomal protein L9
MKVILMDNVKGLGRKGDVKTVSDGYFLNFLAPKNLAKLATDDAVKSAEAKRQKEVIEKERLKEEVRQVQSKLEGLEIKIKGKAKGEHLYASITAEDLIKQIVDKVKIRLDKGCFPAGLHLKEVGRHSVELKLAEGLKANLKVEIVADPT